MLKFDKIDEKGPFNFNSICLNIFFVSCALNANFTQILICTLGGGVMIWMILLYVDLVTMILSTI